MPDPLPPDHSSVERAARYLADQFGYATVFDEDEGTCYDAGYWRHLARGTLAAAVAAESEQTQPERTTDG